MTAIRRLSAAATLPTTAPLIVFDDTCVLCSGLVQWVIRHDRHGRFRFTSAQGSLGQALYRDLDLDPDRLETSLLVVDGVAYAKLAGIIEIATRLGGIWRAAALLRPLPAPLSDWAYDRIAQNRYALFGRRKTCWTPSPDVADRVI
jgi:predicted DCC family thiol-disulfide oxidoreductase YuxK